MRKIIIFNGMMTVSGLILDLTGVIAMNSATVAISGAVFGIIDTVSYIYIMKHRNCYRHGKRHKLTFFRFHHLPNLPFLGLVSHKRHEKGVKR